jgi:uncharacterized iron-regulated membrane protein
MKVFRSLLFWLHLGVGLGLGLVIATMAATGFVLAFERQITTAFGTPKATGSADAPRIPVDAVLAHLPQQGSPTQLVEHRDRQSLLEVRYGRESTLLADPHTGQIVGQPSRRLHGFFELDERIHRRLGLSMQNAFGRSVTGAAALGFLCILLSGIVLWFPRKLSGANWRARLLLRRGLAGKARDWNQHNAIGLWLLLPLAAIAATGVIMAYPWATNLLYRATGSEPPVAAEKHGPPAAGREDRRGHGDHGAAQAQTALLEPMVAMAAQQVPAWQSIALTVPGAKDETVAITVDAGPGGMPEKVTRMAFDRQTGRLVRVERFSDQVMGRRLRLWARFVHTGEEFGLWGQSIAALAALGALWLVWTGWAMSWRRFFGSAKRA